MLKITYRLSKLRFPSPGFTLPFLRHILLIFIMSLSCWHSVVHKSKADCPNVCQCKWKNGKDSAMCHNANLTSIPSPFDTGTQMLDLSGNNIRQLNQDVFIKSKLLNLQKLYLTNCQVSFVDTNAFRMLLNLVELDLSFNMIQSIPSESLKLISALRELKLNGNPIHSIKNNAFEMLPQLIRLELANCEIEQIQLKAFAGLENRLEWLKLNGNNLRTIHAETITSLKNLHGVELAYNKWNCSCILRPLRQWLFNKNIPYRVPPVCYTPRHLNGKSWESIDADEFACGPHVIAYERIIFGTEGHNITMRCSITTGWPKPFIYWKMIARSQTKLIKLKESYLNGYKKQIRNNSRISVETNQHYNASDLIIFNVEVNDAGTYKCIAENNAGKSEAIITLTIVKEPIEWRFNVHIIASFIGFAIIIILSIILFVHITYLRRGKRKKLMFSSTVPLVHSDCDGTDINNHLQMPRSCDQKKYSFDHFSSISETQQIAPTIVQSFSKEDYIRKEKHKSVSLIAQEQSCSHDIYDGNQLLRKGSVDDTVLNVKRQDYSDQTDIVSNQISMSQLLGIRSNDDHLLSFVDTKINSRVVERDEGMSGNLQKKQKVLTANKSCEIPARELYDLNLQLSAYKRNHTNPEYWYSRKTFTRRNSAEYLNNNNYHIITKRPFENLSALNKNFEYNGQRCDSEPKLATVVDDYSDRNPFHLSRNTSRKQCSIQTKPSSTPLYDLSTIRNKLDNVESNRPITDLTDLPISEVSSAISAFNNHAAQLAEFLDMYRNLQKELVRMSESCNGIRQQEALKLFGDNHSEHLVNPVMYSFALSCDQTPQHIRTLKTKGLSEQHKDKPQYWLNRNDVLNKISEL